MPLYFQDLPLWYTSNQLEKKRILNYFNKTGNIKEYIFLFRRFESHHGYSQTMETGLQPEVVVSLTVV